MKVKCKECEYEREHMGEYEDYECPICNSILNENKQDFFPDNNLKEDIGEIGGSSFTPTPLENETVSLLDEAISEFIASFKRDIEKMGKERVWKVIEGLVPAKVRMRYRKFYFLAIEELKEENLI